jgi:hypothetical protein
MRPNKRKEDSREQRENSTLQYCNRNRALDFGLKNSSAFHNRRKQADSPKRNDSQNSVAKPSEFPLPSRSVLQKFHMEAHRNQKRLMAPT